jgi:hypothetical protein
MRSLTGTSYCIAVFVLLVLSLCQTSGADAPSREYQVKAAFIYNFTQFVEWPADSFAKDDSPFVVIVLGNDPFNGALEQTMAHKVVGSHPIVVKHCGSVDSMEPCQLLFVASGQAGSMNAILSKIGKNPVLTVGESDSFMSDGGAVRLFLDGGHMKFELNPDVCTAARLVVSAKLMSLAKIYKK